METSVSMAEELRHVLSFYSEEKQKHLDILQTPDIFIDQRSTARLSFSSDWFMMWLCREVGEWLKAKQFSGRVVGQLGGLSGRQVSSNTSELL